MAIDTEPTTATDAPISPGAFWEKWFLAVKQIVPLYLAIHLAVLAITCLSTLYLKNDGASGNLPLNTLWQIWNRWDTQHYIYLATHGYTQVWRTAFFPLYSFAIRIFVPFTHNNPLIAGLVISSIADLVWMIVLYQLVLEDFGRESAKRTVLYLSIFPTAFFFLAAYTESLFLGLAVLSFYHARRGNWWLSGLCGLFACLTRQTGVVLILPFCYEYLRQHHFCIRRTGWNVMSGFLIPAGIGLFALYCWKKFGDPLAFAHQESNWSRQLMLPWWGIGEAISQISQSHGLLSFWTLRSLIDLVPDLLILLLILLGCVGPWRFRKDYWAYLLYAISLYLICNLDPNVYPGVMPLQSVGRYMLEVFPAFIVLVSLGKSRWLHVCYIFMASSVCYFFLMEFLTGRWIT